MALTLSKHELGLELGNEHLMHAAQQDVDNWLCGGRQLYELAKQTWQNKSKLERYELVGNYAVDLLLLKGLPQAGKLAGIKNLAAYKPQAFTKLGEIGREINQIAGLTCAKGVKTIEQNLEIIRIYPQIVQSKQLSSEAVLYSNKCLKASKNYLRKLGKYATKCAINKEQRLVKLGKRGNIITAYPEVAGKIL